MTYTVSFQGQTIEVDTQASAELQPTICLSQQEIEQGYQEQVKLDHDIDTIEQICECWGTQAILDIVTALDIRQQQERRRPWRDGDFPSEAYQLGGYDHCGCSHDMPDEF